MPAETSTNGASRPVAPTRCAAPAGQEKPSSRAMKSALPARRRKTEPKKWFFTSSRSPTAAKARRPAETSIDALAYAKSARDLHPRVRCAARIRAHSFRAERKAAGKPQDPGFRVHAGL